MYRIYLRWPDQRVSDKTVTSNSNVAETAFRALLGRGELVGKKVAAVLSLDNRQLEYCRFDYGPDWAQGLKPPDAPIRLFHGDPDTCAASRHRRAFDPSNNSRPSGRHIEENKGEPN